MKSYIQGLITGGVLVFAMFVLMGANDNSSEIERYTFHNLSTNAGSVHLVFDTTTGQGYYQVTPYNGDIYHGIVSYGLFKMSMANEIEKSLKRQH